MIAAMYELIGRVVVRLAWWRFRREITIAGALALGLAAAAGYVLVRREPPEG